MRTRRTQILSDESLEVEVIGHDKGIEISVDLQKCLEELENERELMSMVPFPHTKR